MMIKRIDSQTLVLTISTLTLSLASDIALADLYKWRDARGVVQYSATVPANITKYTKATQNELVDSIQKRDVCSGSSTTSKSNSEQITNKLKSTKLSNLNNLSLHNFSFISSAEASALDYSIFGAKVRSYRFSSVLDTSPKSLLDYVFPPRPAPAPAPTAAPRPAPAPTAAPRPAPAPTAAPRPAPAPTAAPRPAPAPAPVTFTQWLNSRLSTPSLLSFTPTPAPKPAPAPAPKPAPAPAPAPKPAPAPAPAPAPTPTPTPTPTGANIIQQGLMPAVDTSKNMTQIIGLNYLDVKADNMPSAGDGNGQFRLQCLPTHMSNDDPIVYPNQQGAAHHHTFFGNVTINYKTDVNNLANVGNTACMGGTANRSAYWIPSLIDTTTNTPLKPSDGVWYYKTGYIVPPRFITVPPKGLRLIAGNMKATTLEGATVTGFKCTSTNYTSEWGHGKSIPSCGANNNLLMSVSFPQCWDGKNLDSPNHQDHMAYSSVNYGTANSCPTTHPIAIPHITLNIHWRIPSHNPPLRLSSDNYAYNGSNAGYSAHSDWINGWQEDIITSIVKNCLNAGKECHQGLLGDGRGLAWMPYPLK